MLSASEGNGNGWSSRGKPLGSAIKDLITIVTPRSFARWVSTADKTKKEKKSTRNQDGRGGPRRSGN